jgi:hypothetical protein
MIRCRIVLSVLLALPACAGPAPKPTVGDHCRELWGAYCDSAARCSTSHHDHDACVEFAVEQLCCAGSTCEEPSTLEEAEVDTCVEDFETRTCGVGLAEDSVCRRIMEL